MAALGGGNVAAGAVRAGRAFVEIFAKDEEFSKGLVGIRAKFRSFGASMAKIGFGSALGGGSVLGTLVLAMRSAINTSAELKDVADRLGAPIEEINALGYAAEMSGASLADMESAVAKLQQAIASGKQIGGLDTGTLFGLPLPEQMDAIAEAFAGITDQAYKMELAVGLFGKTGRTLLPVFAGGAAGMAAFRKEAARVTGMTEEEAKRLDTIGKEIQRVWMTFTSVFRTVGAAALGTVDAVKRYAAAIEYTAIATRNFINENQTLVQVLTLATAGVTLAGLALGGLGVASMAASAGIAVLAKVWAALTLAMLGKAAIIVGVGAGLAGLVAIVYNFTDAGKGFTQAWQGMVDAVKGGDLTLAGKIAFTGLKVEFFAALQEMGRGWGLFASGVMGAMIGSRAGPWGALIGAGVGAGGAGIAGQVAGNQRAAAQLELEALLRQARQSSSAAAKARTALQNAIPIGGFSGASKGGFGTSSILGRQLGIADGAKMLEAMRGTERNTEEMSRKLNSAGPLVWAV